MSTSIDAYNKSAQQFADTYESLSTEQILPALREILRQSTTSVLDIGAGSGRDAAWMAQQGFHVVAVEPAEQLLAEAIKRHGDAGIEWLSDCLPELSRTRALGYRFDFILLSAVWMHVPPEQRSEAFDNIVELLKPGGRVLFTLRHGPSPSDRPMFEVSVEELESLARRHFAVVSRSSDESKDDQLGQASVWWEQALVSLPAADSSYLELH